jgi:hypothetical protein
MTSHEETGQRLFGSFRWCFDLSLLNGHHLRWPSVQASREKIP